MWLDSYLWQFNLFRAFDFLCASQLYRADKPFWGQMLFCLVSIVHVSAPVGLLTFWHSSYSKRAFIYGHHVQCSVLKKQGFSSNNIRNMEVAWQSLWIIMTIFNLVPLLMIFEICRLKCPTHWKLFMCGLAWETSSEVLCDVSVYLIASMLPLPHLCGPLQEALLISLPDEGESVAGFHHLRRSLWTGILVSSL